MVAVRPIEAQLDYKSNLLRSSIATLSASSKCIDESQCDDANREFFFVSQKLCSFWTGVVVMPERKVHAVESCVKDEFTGWQDLLHVSLEKVYAVIMDSVIGKLYHGQREAMREKYFKPMLCGVADLDDLLAQSGDLNATLRLHDEALDVCPLLGNAHATLLDAFGVA